MTFRFISWDGDGYVDDRDLDLIMEFITDQHQRLTHTEDDITMADLDGSGFVDADDVALADLFLNDPELSGNARDVRVEEIAPDATPEGMEESTQPWATVRMAWEYEFLRP